MPPSIESSAHFLSINIQSLYSFISETNIHLLPMRIVVTTSEELQQLIENAVQRSLKSLIPAFIQEISMKPYLTRDEVLNLTGWSLRTLNYKRSKRQIPFIQHGRKILYPTADFLAFLETGRVSSTSDSINEFN